MRQHTYAVPAPTPAPIVEARPARGPIRLASRAEGEASKPEMLASASERRRP